MRDSICTASSLRVSTPGRHGRYIFCSMASSVKPRPSKSESHALTMTAAPAGRSRHRAACSSGAIFLPWLPWALPAGNIWRLLFPVLQMLLYWKSANFGIQRYAVSVFSAPAGRKTCFFGVQIKVRVLRPSQAERAERLDFIPSCLSIGDADPARRAASESGQFLYSGVIRSPGLGQVHWCIFPCTLSG